MCDRGTEDRRARKRKSKEGMFMRMRKSNNSTPCDEGEAIIELSNGNIHTTDPAMESLDSQDEGIETKVVSSKGQANLHSTKENYSKDWIRIAEVFDRLFFWMFLLAIVISTLVLFHPIIRYQYGVTESQTLQGALSR